MSTKLISISFFTATMIIVVNKQLIGVSSVDVGDIWHKLYYMVNSFAYLLPSLVILNYLKGIWRHVFTLVPAFYLEWAYASWFYDGGISCLDIVEMLLGVVLVYFLSNYKSIKRWATKKTK